MKQFLIFASLLILSSTGLAAQTRTSGLYSISVSPPSLALSTLDLGLERRMADRVSLLAQGFYGWRSIQLWESLKGNYTNYGGRLECRGYLGKNAETKSGAIWGPYFAGWIKGSMAQVSTLLQQKEYTIVKSQSLTPGLGMGWKFPLSRKWAALTFDVSVGGGYRFGNVSGRYAEHSRSILFKDNGLVPAIGFRVAYTPGATRKATEKTAKTDTSPSFAGAIAYHDRYSRQERLAIEQALQRHSLNPGPVDGIFDEKTIRAIMKFQKKCGLDADGMAGPATRKKLGI